MAIGSVGAGGFGADFANVATYNFTSASNGVVSGNFGILTNVTDNTSTTDGNNTEHTSVTGGTGTWTKLGEYTNSNGVAAAGVTVSVWLFEATALNAIGTVFTLNFASARVDKCCSFRVFSKDAAAHIILDPAAGTNPITSGVDASNGFGSSAFSGLDATATKLYFAGYGKEANSTTQITTSASFTAIAVARSQNNANAVLCRGEYRINASTGETSAPTLAVSGDTAGLFFALVEQNTGALAKTIDDVTLASTGQVIISGALSKTIDDFTVASTGQVQIAGALSKTLDDFTLSSTALLSGILDQGDYAGHCNPQGSCAQTTGWFVSGTKGIAVTGDGGFILEDTASGPLGATVHSQAFQLGVDPDFWMSMWVQADSTPAVTPRVLWSHERTASSWVALRQKTDGTLEWVMDVGAGEVVIVTSTTALSTSDPTHILLNMHGGETSIGINGAWEDSATDHTDYDQFSAGVGSGSVRFLGASVSGDNFIGKADDIKAKTGAYFTVATVGNSYPVPATSP